VTSQAAFGPPFFPKGSDPFSSDTRNRGLTPVVVVAVLLAGCATERAYEGPALAKNERAVVRADPVVSAGLPVQIRIRKADGHDVGLAASKVELPPGKHSFVIDCRIAETGAVRRFTLEEELDAGGHYRVVANATARNCEAVALIGD
jgi:hypothetical protein